MEHSSSADPIVAALDAAVETAAEEHERAELATEAAEAALEIAAEQVEAAIGLGEELAEAAMMTDLGRRVTAIEERVESCHQYAAQNADQTAGIISRMASIETALADLTSRSIPQPSTPQTPEPENVPETNPETVPPAPEPEPALPPKKRKRWM